MAQKRYKGFTITGAANARVEDVGIESTEAEPKRVVAIWFHVSGYQGNVAEAWVEREQYINIHDYFLDTEANTGTTNTLYSTAKQVRFPVNIELPLGQRFRAALTCGPTATNLRGIYEYEIM